MLLVLALLATSGFGVRQFLYPFLAVTQPVGGDYLVVEGWMDLDEFRQALIQFRSGHYTKIITTGCIAKDEWNPEAKVSFAQWGASKLQHLGLPSALIEQVPCWEERKDRTFYSALAVKHWSETNGIALRRIDVVSAGPHSRRSRLLYQKAFAGTVRVGIIAARESEFDLDHWWNSSEGVREMLGEAIAYIYARIFFRVPAEVAIISR
jgi:hypothetical protein